MTYFDFFIKEVAVIVFVIASAFLAAGLYGRWRYHTDWKETARSILPPLAILILEIWVIRW